MAYVHVSGQGREPPHAGSNQLLIMRPTGQPADGLYKRRDVTGWGDECLFFPHTEVQWKEKAVFSITFNVTNKDLTTSYTHAY